MADLELATLPAEEAESRRLAPAVPSAPSSAGRAAAEPIAGGPPCAGKDLRRAMAQQGGRSSLHTGPTRCPRCQGNLIRHEDGASCLLCGHVVYKDPPLPFVEASRSLQKDAPCHVGGCEQPARSRGLCKGCGAQFYATGRHAELVDPPGEGYHRRRLRGPRGKNWS